MIVTHATFLAAVGLKRGGRMSTAIKQLHIPIQSLDFSTDFKEMTRVNHFRTLSQMVELPVEVLQKLPLFNHRMLAEYISYLTKHGLDDLVEG